MPATGDAAHQHATNHATGWRVRHGAEGSSTATVSVSAIGRWRPSQATSIYTRACAPWLPTLFVWRKMAAADGRQYERVRERASHRRTHAQRPLPHNCYAGKVRRLHARFSCISFSYMYLCVCCLSALRMPLALSSRGGFFVQQMGVWLGAGTAGPDLPRMRQPFSGDCCTQEPLHPMCVWQQGPWLVHVSTLGGGVAAPCRLAHARHDNAKAAASNDSR